jgi:hypothetical protein
VQHLRSTMMSGARLLTNARFRSSAALIARQGSSVGLSAETLAMGWIKQLYTRQPRRLTLVSAR